jgi:uncharacterized protein YggE
MKKGYLVTTGLLLILVVALLSGCGRSTVGILSSQQEGIWVTGTGKVTVTPDLANLSLGIEAQEASVAQAQSEAGKAMNDVISALKEQEIADEDIQTKRFSIQQVTRYDREAEQEIVIGYRVTNVVITKIRDLERVGNVIDSIAEAGGDLIRINSINFSVEDHSTYHDEARAKAVNDAKDRADKLANLAGISLGKPTYISEVTQGIPTPIRLASEAPAPVAAPVETPISPGEMEVTLTVQIAYEIKR